MPIPIGGPLEASLYH